MQTATPPKPILIAPLGAVMAAARKIDWYGAGKMEENASLQA
ncbi:hypothetical protein [Duganella sp. sic0402]|nr:hypothetical protein [Duganella sp. sic0402]